MTEEQGVTGAAPRPGQDLAEYLDGLNSFGMDHLVAMRMRDARRGQIVRDSAAGPIRDSTAAFFVCGQTGAGKSTLLNELGSVSAQEGIGRPVTTHFEGFPLNERGGVLWDGPGFERGNSASELLREIRPTLNVVDLVWFCFRGGSHRYDDAELDVVAYLRESVPTVLVITQDVDGELGKVLEGDPRVSGLPVVSVLAREWTLRSGTVEAFGLDALAGVSIEAIRQGTTSKA